MAPAIENILFSIRFPAPQPPRPGDGLCEVIRNIALKVKAGEALDDESREILDNFLKTASKSDLDEYNKIVSVPRVGPSGRVSTRKYLEKNWDKATFGTKRKSIEYHVGKHGKGLSQVEYTQQAVKAFRNPAAKKIKTVDLQGRPAVKVDSPEGRGLFTLTGKIIWFHPFL